ncbi:tail fiber domain-containing protein [Flavobacterium sp.]|uniref:tail fiber domain-containing protein n=1 Tax=Flavobacterium sp. TaxID=239 RepID=UPI00374D2B9D
MNRLTFLLLLVSFKNYSQVGINTITPNALFEIKSSNQISPSNTDGIIIPKVDVFPAINPTISQQGMLVYLTTVDGTRQPGFYYWDNAWNSFGWGLKGNGGTNPTSNFVGTTDDNDLIFKRNNVQSGLIGTTNTSFGLNALSTLNTGINNTAYGLNSLFSNTSGRWNIANGSNALYSNTTGSFNTSYGSNALYSNTDGFHNTACGFQSMYYNTTGFGNSTLGTSTLSRNTIGGNNVAIGNTSLTYNTTGDLNVGCGASALNNNRTGSRNTAIGSFALANSIAGENNVAIGANALSLATGSNNIGIGYNSIVPNAAGDNQVQIGNTSINYAGIQVAWSVTSDNRWKSNIQKSNLGLDFIKKLNPVSYIRNNDKNKKIEYGFIAQELEQTLNTSDAINNAIITKDDSGMYSVRYNDLLSPMVKAIQDQQKIIESQNKRIELLESKIKEIEEKL